LVPKNELKESKEVRILKNIINEIQEKNNLLCLKNNELALELKKLTEVNNSHQNSSFNSNPSLLPSSAINKQLPFNFKDKNNDKQLGLIDKCDHFKGNYKPIFACCDKAYPCYLCHNEKQTHSYEFSNKVVCLICNDIYTGNQCSQCNAVQIYKKKH
jgi:uncharacterized CHY-type Zn-finger protein